MEIKKVPEDMLDYVQSLDFEATGLKVLHTHAIMAGAPEARTQEIYSRFQEVYAALNLAKHEIFKWAGGRGEQRYWIDYVDGTVMLDG